ncbi:MAG TPA: ATP-binding protein [Methylocella sp.]|nr:ATP-binding protein [Methylocella sp.]
MEPDAEDRDHLIVSRLIEALPEAVIVIGASDRVIAVNAPARELFPAVRRDELLSRALRAPEVLDAIRRVHATGTPERATWLERVPLERYFEIHVAPIVWPQDDMMMILTLQDLTESRRVERMRVDFVANASHELRTPLASLLGFIETLQGSARADVRAREKFLSIMGEQARRMARLVDDLLSLSRIEQNLHLRPQTAVDMVAILLHIADTLTPMAADNEVVLTLDVPEKLIVTGDRDELLRVAENLIENAIKYGASDPRSTSRQVQAILRVERRQCVLQVLDQGPGIPPEHLPRLTERFYRVDAGQSRAKGGTGLGLAIVKHIVARHRGRLSIESTMNKGTTVRVSLPLLANDPLGA